MFFLSMNFFIVPYEQWCTDSVYRVCATVSICIYGDRRATLWTWLSPSTFAWASNSGQKLCIANTLLDEPFYWLGFANSFLSEYFY